MLTALDIKDFHRSVRRTCGKSDTIVVHLSIMLETTNKFVTFIVLILKIHSFVIFYLIIDRHDTSTLPWLHEWLIKTMSMCGATHQQIYIPVIMLDCYVWICLNEKEWITKSMVKLPTWAHCTDAHYPPPNPLPKSNP